MGTGMYCDGGCVSTGRYSLEKTDWPELAMRSVKRHG